MSRQSHEDTRNGAAVLAKGAVLTDPLGHIVAIPLIDVDQRSGRLHETALLCSMYGFLAVFAAGLALRRVERRHMSEHTNDEPSVFVPGQKEDEVATDPKTAPAAMAEGVLHFNQQLEHLGELAVVLLIGAMLSWRAIPVHAAWFVPLVLLGIRPVSVAAGLLGSGVPARERLFAAWFGIRGIGSLYYLMYAVVHGVAEPHARLLIGLTLATITASAVTHGVSVTPLMRLYNRVAIHSESSPGTR